ncbi:MAG: hypothetical protein HGA54_10325, partial [Actinobacteria bacterium]|nr:hypothetical protein [Actinomycetota bacterium]
MKLLRGILAVVLTALVAFSALGVSFSATLLPPATSLFANLFADETASGFEHSEMVAVAEGVRAFSLGDDEADLPLGTDYKTALTQDAIDHLLEVRAVFYWALLITA